jgi:hypothetical protein
VTISVLEFSSTPDLNKREVGRFLLPEFLQNICNQQFMGIPETESYRNIRSKRQRKRATIEARDKKLIGLYKESQRLSKQKRELPMVNLSPPVQKGWKRYFIVREDVRRSRDGVFYENLLQKINTVQYSDEKVFRKKKRKAGKRIYYEIEQGLKTIKLHELFKMKFTDRELSCFEYRTIYEVRKRRIETRNEYVFKEPWRYVLRIRPNIIDKIRVHDAELEQRIKIIDMKLYKNYLNYGRLAKIRDWGYDRWGDMEKEKYRNPLKDKSLHAIMGNDF